MLVIKFIRFVLELRMHLYHFFFFFLKLHTDTLFFKYLPMPITNTYCIGRVGKGVVWEVGGDG